MIWDAVTLKWSPCNEQATCYLSILKPLQYQCSVIKVQQIFRGSAGIIPCMHPANERHCYNVTSSLTGRAHTQTMYAPSQWETTLQCNVVSHWLGAYTKWSLGLGEERIAGSFWHSHITITLFSYSSAYIYIYIYTYIYIHNQSRINYLRKSSGFIYAKREA